MQYMNRFYLHKNTIDLHIALRKNVLQTLLTCCILLRYSGTWRKPRWGLRRYFAISVQSRFLSPVVEVGRYFL